MGRAAPITGLPIDTWASILGIDPWSFNNCKYPAPKGAQCSDCLYQFPWQADHLSRTEVAEAIADAEQMLASELLYWPFPRHFVGEIQPYPRPHQRDRFGFAGDIRGNWKTIQLNNHKFISGGVFNRTAIVAAPVITKLDEDGDGVYETFEAVVTDAAISAITDPYELGLYFVAANRHGEAISETWRVRPLTITISGNVATFRGHRTLLINPELEFGVNQTRLDATVDANYVTDLECWRVFTDNTATAALPYQGVAEWKNIPDCTQDCTFSIKEICLGEHNNEAGRVFASFGNTCDWPFPDREPDRVSVNYLAGLALVDGQIPDVMARIITYLSVSLLANEKCGCDRSNRILARWKERITKYEGNGADGSAAAFAYSNTPFPMTVGGQYAWLRVKRMRDMEVVGL